MCQSSINIIVISLSQLFKRMKSMSLKKDEVQMNKKPHNSGYYNERSSRNQSNL